MTDMAQMNYMTHSNNLYKLPRHAHPTGALSRRTFTAAAAGAGLGASAFMLNTARAQSAGKTITLVVPAPAGGTADISARAISDSLSKALGQPVAVDKDRKSVV